MKHHRFFYDGLALVAGIVSVFAFAPFEVFPLAFVSMAILFALWQHYPQRALWQTWLFCVGQLGFGVSWLHISFHEFSGIALSISLLLTALFVMFVAACFLLAGWWVRKRSASVAWNYLVYFPMLWLWVEWFKSWFLTGFPWLSLGYSQIDNLPLAGYAPLLGVYGVSLMVLVSAGAGAYCVDQRKLKPVSLLVVALIWVGGWLHAHVDWTYNEGEAIKVSLIQGNVSQDVKWLAGYQIPTLQMYQKFTQAHWDSDLIVWPETAVPAMYHQVKQYYLEPLSKQAKAHGTEVILGVPVVDNNRYYNSVVALGEKIQFYHKVHLVPFGEFMPLQSLLAPLLSFLSIPMSDFRPGDADQPMLTVQGHPVDTTICYEDAFGEDIVRHLPEAKLLVNVSNDAWFGDSLAPHQHLQMARMRALETGRYMVRGTNTGISAVIGPDGKIQQSLPQFERGVLVSDQVHFRGGATPYVWWGNGLLIGVLLLFGVLQRGIFSFLR